jgi:preprotein translocase subunit YajC
MFNQLPLTLAFDEDAPLPNPGTTPTTAPGTPANPGTPGTPVAPTGQQQRAPGLFDNSFLLILFLGLIFMIFISMRSQRKERKKREELLSSLKKGDKVQSIGGILGTVVEVRNDRVIVKVDETNNTKLAFVRAAIQAVIPDGEAAKQEAEVKKDS